MLIAQDGVWGLEGWRFMFLVVAIPAIVVGIIAWFYLKDRPSDAKWLTAEESTWLERELQGERVTAEEAHKHVSIRHAFGSGRVWMLSFIYFGFIYGLYALAFFLPTIITGFQEQAGVEAFDPIQKGLITAIPYLPAAIALYFWSADAHRRGLKSWHIVIPALAGAISIPLALFAGSPAATIAVITVTAMAIFSALPNFWTLPTQFLTGVAAAAGVALINTVGNIAGFSAPYITGLVTDVTGDFKVPMFIVGFFMLLSAVLMLILSRQRHTAGSDSPTAAPLVFDETVERDR
ncbi:hypothetical protein GCM10025866_14460 [Naasia aerilata]|uniref:Major facilitator superfamily (MFS) profile domain-containing protein n=1 Tax=Naasia aerilata TaxID=1162966 RepID=A0ABM8GBE1_9MICO|nr:hypothetical protein GCM10025866_14460 [Naasia aerilata]